MPGTDTDKSEEDRRRVSELQEENLRRLAAWLIELCRKHNYSEKYLADSADIGRGHLSEILHAKSNVTMQTLARLAYALDVGIDDLLKPTPPALVVPKRGGSKTRRTR